MLRRKVFQIITQQDFQRLLQKQSLDLQEFRTITQIAEELKSKNKIGYVLMRLNLKHFGFYGFSREGITLSSPGVYISNIETFHVLPLEFLGIVPDEYLELYEAQELDDRIENLPTVAHAKDIEPIIKEIISKYAPRSLSANLSEDIVDCIVNLLQRKPYYYEDIATDTTHRLADWVNTNMGTSERVDNKLSIIRTYCRLAKP